MGDFMTLSTPVLASRAQSIDRISRKLNKLWVVTHTPEWDGPCIAASTAEIILEELQHVPMPWQEHALCIC